MICKGISAAAIVILYCTPFLCAEDGPSKKELFQEIRALKERAAKQEKRIEELESKILREDERTGRSGEDSAEDNLEEHVDSHLLHRISGYRLNGLRIGLGGTFVMQGTEGNVKRYNDGTGGNVMDWSYSADLEFENQFGDHGLAFLHIETGDGAGIDDELTVFSGVNFDADDADNSPALTELWYEHYFRTVPLTLTAGMLDPTVYIDTNEFANDETTQFLAPIFRNSPAVEFPDNGPGFHFGLEPSESVNLHLLVMDGDSDWEDTADGVFAGLQIGLTAVFAGREGNYRLAGWFSDTGHVGWSDPLFAGGEARGAGLSFDQRVSENTAIFGRYALRDGDVHLPEEDFTLERSWSAGFHLSGGLWGRGDDAFAVAFGQAVPSDDYRLFVHPDARSEEHLELYYSLKVNDHLALTPDIQIIRNPHVADADNGDTIFIGGLRAQVDF